MAAASQTSRAARFWARRSADILIVATLVVVGVSAMIAARPLLYAAEALVLVTPNPAIDETERRRLLKTEALILASKQPDNGADRLEGLRVGTVADTNVLSARYVAGDPALAAATLNAVIAAYIDQRAPKPPQETSTIAQDEDIETARARRDESRRALEAAQSAFDAVDPDLIQNLAAQETALTAELLAISQTRRGQAGIYPDAHPVIQSLDRDLQDTRRRLSAVSDELNAIAALERDVRSADDAVQTAQSAYETASRRGAEPPQAPAEPDAQRVSVRLIAAARPPESPHGSPFGWLLGAIVGGLALGVVVAWIRDRLAGEV